MAAPRNVYMVNYFPIVHGGYEMWTNYNGVQYQADMVTAKNLGFNTMRVFLAAYQAFNFPSPTTGQLANLTDFYNRAKTVGIKLHITLFDYWGEYGRINDCETWLTAIMSALPDTTMVQCLELQNETKYSSTAAYSATTSGTSGGFDSGWPNGTTQYTTLGPVTLVWAQQMVTYIRANYPGIAVTTSTTLTTSGWTNDLQAIVTATLGTAQEFDWYDWHCYMTDMRRIPLALKAVIAVVQDPAKLFIGETGVDTSAVPSTEAAYIQSGLQGAYDYLLTVRWWCQELGLPEPGQWSLFDISPSAQFAPGNYYGLFDTSGNIKLPGKLYQQIPPGYRIPALSINGTMSIGSYTDLYSNILPYRWMIFKGNNGNQPIQATVDTATLYQGNPTILLTGSSATSGSDNPPGLEIRPQTYPLLSGGQSYTFSVAIKGTGTTGTPSLTLSWYDINLGYISGNNSGNLTISSTFSRYNVTGTSPAGSVYLRVILSAGYNAGSIWVGGGSWSGATPRLAINNGQWLRR